jgi:hypothetical protein
MSCSQVTKALKHPNGSRNRFRDQHLLLLGIAEGNTRDIEYKYSRVVSRSLISCQLLPLLLVIKPSFRTLGTNVSQE